MVKNHGPRLGDLDMYNPLSDVPWGNLWQWVVSSLFLFTVIGMPIAFLTTLD